MSRTSPPPLPAAAVESRRRSPASLERLFRADLAEQQQQQSHVRRTTQNAQGLAGAFAQAKPRVVETTPPLHAMADESDGLWLLKEGGFGNFPLEFALRLNNAARASYDEDFAAVGTLAIGLERFCKAHGAGPRLAGLCAALASSAKVAQEATGRRRGFCDAAVAADIARLRGAQRLLMKAFCDSELTDEGPRSPHLKGDSLGETQGVRYRWDLSVDVEGNACLSDDESFWNYEEPTSPSRRRGSPPRSFFHFSRPHNTTRYSDSSPSTPRARMVSKMAQFARSASRIGPEVFSRLVKRSLPTTSTGDTEGGISPRSVEESTRNTKRGVSFVTPLRRSATSSSLSSCNSLLSSTCNTEAFVACCNEAVSVA